MYHWMICMRVNSPQEADIIVQKLPSDMGIHRNPRKGTLDAPGKIMGQKTFDSDLMVDEVFPDEFDLEETQSRIENNTRELSTYSRPLLSLGGDHSVSYPVIKSLKEEQPDLQLVWLDSHLDLKKKVDDHVSHDVVVRELLDHFDESDIHFIGVTRKDSDEEELLENREFDVRTPVEAEDAARCIEGPVYLSVDIDVLRQKHAPGTGYPDGEMDPEQVRSVISCLDVSHADLVEVAPSLDDGRTLENARSIMEWLESALTD